MSHDVEIGGGVTVLTTVLTLVWAPWSNEAKKRRRRRRIMKLYIDGQDGEDGLLETVLSAPVRMKNCENDIGELKETYGKIKRGSEHNIAETSQLRDEVGHLRSEVGTLTGLMRELLRLWNPNLTFAEAVRWESDEKTK